MSWWLALLALAAVLMAMVDEPTSAQETEEGQEQAAEATEEEKGLFLDEIVVSAQKREENLQEVPIAITAFSDLQIEEAGIESAEDLLGMTANITIGNSFTVGNSFVTVRGISQINNSDPPVAIVIDGVYQANQKQLNQELFDVERIEVLKGPQGSLYGRNSLGGAINIVTRKPTADLGGWIQLGTGSSDALRLAGSVSGALGEKARGRLAASRRENDGRIRNVFLDELADPYEDTTIRARLDASPTDQLSLDFRFQTSDTEGGAVLYSLLPTDGGAQRFDIRPDENILGFSERQVDEFTFKLDYLANGWSVTSISAFTDLQETYRGDLDFSNPVRFPAAFPLGQGQDLDVSYLSQEIRVASADDADVRWLGGVYYLETERELTTIPFFDADGTIDGFVPLFFIGEDNDNTAYAVFGQVDFQLADHWSASVGIRYDEDERNQIDTINGGERSRTFDDTQPRLTISYSKNPDLMVYASTARGFRSGGFNAPPINPDFFRKETSQNFEVGFKSTLADNRVRLNGAAYLNQVDNFQFFRIDVLTASQIIDNISEVEMTGVELDLTARVAQGFDLFASAGFNDASIEDFDGSGRFIGNQSPNNVKSTINLGAQYSVGLREGWLLVLHGNAELRGKQYWFADNLDVTDKVEFFNARVSVESERWSVTAWGKNITDEEFWAEYFDALWGGIPSGMDLGHRGRRSTFGIDFKLRF
ncbi:MAG: TonB-dependent receptor [Acidobacteriota bacterium]